MATLSDNSEENYTRFIEEAIGCGCVWGLEGPGGWALCPSEKYDTSEAMPFWSQPEFAQVHCREEWEGYRVTAVALEEFLEDWLPGMHADVYLVGVNWGGELEGAEVEPLDLLEAFDQALEQ